MRYTLNDFPVGGFIMTPQTQGRPHKPLEVVAHLQGEPRVQPKGEAAVSVSLHAKGVEPVTQDILSSWEFTSPMKHSEFKELIQKGDIDALCDALAGLETNVERVACIVRKYPRQGDGTTLLHIAAGHVNASVAEDRSIEVMRYLLGALSCWDLTDVLDSNGQTPLWDALMALHHPHIVEMIKHQPAGTRAKLVQFTDDLGQNALMATVQQCAEEVRNEGDVSDFAVIARYLIAKGTDVKAADNSGWTVVHHCVPRESSRASWVALKPSLAADLAALCQLFIEQGCPVDAKDFDGITALFWACAVGDDHLSPLVHTLARSGADPDLVVPGTKSDPQPPDRNTPCKHATFLHGDGGDPKTTMDQILGILRLSPAERRALPAVDTTRPGARPHQAAAAAVVGVAPPARARAPRQRRPSGRGVGSGAGGSARRGGARQAPGAAQAAAQAAPPVQVSAAVQAAVVSLGVGAVLDMLSSILEKPTVKLTGTDFTQHDCYSRRELQLIVNPAILQVRAMWVASPSTQAVSAWRAHAARITGVGGNAHKGGVYPAHCARQAFNAKRAQWHRSQHDHRDNRQPEVVIVACYGCPSAAGQRPPYGTSTAFYFLAKHVEHFFKAPFYGASLHCLS